MFGSDVCHHPRPLTQFSRVVTINVFKFPGFHPSFSWRPGPQVLHPHYSRFSRVRLVVLPTTLGRSSYLVGHQWCRLILVNPTSRTTQCDGTSGMHPVCSSQPKDQDGSSIAEELFRSCCAQSENQEGFSIPEELFRSYRPSSRVSIPGQIYVRGFGRRVCLFSVVPRWSSGYETQKVQFWVLFGIEEW